MKLYHYSHKSDLQEVNPVYFGENSYTLRDRQASGVQRSYFYTKPEPERLLKGAKNLYTVDVPAERIYSLVEDSAGLVPEAGSIDELLQKLEKSYDGVKYSLGYEVVCLFRAVPVEAA